MKSSQFVRLFSQVHLAPHPRYHLRQIPEPWSQLDEDQTLTLDTSTDNLILKAKLLQIYQMHEHYAFLVDEATLVTINQIKYLAAFGLLVCRHFHGQLTLLDTSTLSFNMNE